MFPEYRDLITELKQSNAHFQRLFNEHNDLDQLISNMEKNPVDSHRHEDIEAKKKEKLRLKDELYRMLLAESKN